MEGMGFDGGFFETNHGMGGTHNQKPGLMLNQFKVNNKKIILVSLYLTLNRLHTLFMFLFVVHIGDLQNFWERGRALYGGLSILWGDLITP